jgi:DNA-binding beta-propeller fold protein YncE
MRTPLFVVLAVGCGGATPAPVGPASAPALAFNAHPLALPGAAPGLFLDYLGTDRGRKQVWVPAGGTGAVAVIDPATDALQTVTGFATEEATGRNGQKRVLGPSSATVGAGYVYVGDRAGATVCAVDAGALKRADCANLPSPPDGLAFVEGRSEVWVTTPRQQAIVILDVRTPQSPKIVETMKLAGEPEGFAVDDENHLFFTNLEDKDKTLIINSATRGVVKSWSPGCGADGPKGIAVDVERKLVMVACPDHVKVFDELGQPLGKMPAGAGVDNIDYVPASHRLYVAAARAGTLTVGELGPDGSLVARAVVPTTEGARNAVVAGGGKVYLTDPQHGGLLVLEPK